MSTPLAPLEHAMMQDKVLRDSINSLIDKERRLAELELLLRLSASGAPLTNVTATTANPLHASSSHASSVSSSKTSSSSPLTRIFDDKDPVRIYSSSLAMIPHLPTHTLRPRSNQPDLTTAEITALSASNGSGSATTTAPSSSSSSSTALVTSTKYGLDLSHMHLNDDRVADLNTLFTSLSNAANTLRLLNIRSNDLNKAGASTLVDAIKRFPRLEAVLAEDNSWGGKPGIGTIIDACTRAAVMLHLGITFDESTPLPFTFDIEIIPPGLPKKPAAADKRGRSASPGKKKAPAKKAPSPSKGKGGTKGNTSSTPTGTIAHLTSSIRNNSTITSVSIAGSALSREALLNFVAAWPPPAPIPPTAHGTTHTTSTATAKAGGDAKPKAPAKTAAKPGAAKGGAHGTGGKASHRFTPLTCLDLSRCHIGALGSLDLSVALGPIPVPDSHDPSARLGSITPYSTTTGPADTAAAKGTATKTAPGTVAVPPPPPYVPGHSVHGCLQYLRVLNLSSCGLTSHGLIPLLESVALHCNYLSHLILRDNYIDDAGAGAIATALRMNNERVHTLQADAMAYAVQHHPMFLLTGKNPFGGDVPSLSPNSQIVHHLGIAAGAGLSPQHFTPLRVIDVRNNPLAISGDPSSHPGCVALVEALESLPSVLSIVGPEPSIESVIYYKTLTTTTPSPTNEPLSDDCLIGLGAQYPFDLAAIQAAARAARRGGAVGPSTLLSLPSGLTQSSTSTIIKKCIQHEYTLREHKRKEQNNLGLSDTPSMIHSQEGYGTVIWRLHTPCASQVILPSMSANPHTLNHNTNKILENLPENKNTEPQEIYASASVSVLGSNILQMGIPTGLIGHDEDSPIVRNGTAEWLLHTPQIVLEWRSSYIAPSNIVPFTSNQTLVYHIFVSGPGNRPLQHIQSITFTEGSRDRLHARTRSFEKNGTVPQPDTNLLPTSADPLHPLDTNTNITANRNKLTAWQESTGLDIPRPLGKHNDYQVAAYALPSSLTTQAMISTGTDLVAWPVVWHSIVLPNHIVTSVTDARIHIYAEVQQTGVRQMGSMLTNSNTASVASSTFSYGVHIFEAELVIIENNNNTKMNTDSMFTAVAGLSKSLERVQPDIAFTF